VGGRHGNSCEIAFAAFFSRGERAFLQGVFEKPWSSPWLFCGEFVVKCVVKAG
jgi:hypothetical protein